ncbi:efflux RND transporter periplasmic adaptor subunit [Staphylococcus gallinarum]|uniref:Efflux RND transporter periplasmic adaptor subunit n=1 Tax=Staphylococcus gallinarum TaxID=1293 RepID=A0A3A0VNQ7_STAGA|nr:efflux RND transporter periplasmic adaptor subunit [Staphylococcus gallinarum]RIP35029.1 efflux RND transporter periplasmic adaptor subunit [Staphylococcus gallinarum]
MKNKKLWLSITVLIILIILITYFILRQMNVIDNNKHDSYQTYTIKKTDALNLKGKSSPQTIKVYQENRDIGSYIRPQIQDNQVVKKGTPLIYYDTNSSIRPKLVSNVKKFQAYVEKDYTALNKQPNDSQTQQRLTRDQQQLNQAQHVLNLHDNQSSKDIYAAFDGTVNYINKDVDKNGNILQLVSNKPEIKTTVSEYDIDKIQEGDVVDVDANKGGTKTQGKVIQIADLSTESQKNVDHASKNKSTPISNTNKPSQYEVTIGNLSSSVKDGFTVNMKIHATTAQLPESALTKDNCVFVVDQQNKVHKRPIITGHSKGNIIVKQGVKIGDKIIKKPNTDLQEGQKIEPSDS